MLNRVIIAVVVAVIVTLACILLGAVLVSLNVPVAVTIGSFLKSYSGVIGVLAGLLHYFSGPDIKRI